MTPERVDGGVRAWSSEGQGGTEVLLHRRRSPGGGVPEPLVGRPRYGRIHRYCDDLVRATGVDSLADVDGFVARVADLCGVGISTRYERLRPGEFGGTSAPDEDLRYQIVVGSNLTEEMQVITRLHEVVHILSGHVDGRSWYVCDIDSVRGPMADRERLAETAGSILAVRALAARRRESNTSTGRAERQLVDALMGDLRWGW